MSRHESVGCDNCLQTNFEGIRYKCLICHDYDLCERCHSRGLTTGSHRADHPVQCILTRLDADLFHRGEGGAAGNQDSFTCPFCGQYGFKANDIGTHITSQHSGDSREVICPICTVSSTTDPNHRTDNLANHMAVDHAQSNPRRDTIRQIRRMIYPSGGRGSSTTVNSRRGPRSTIASREIPFMQFVSDMTSGGSANTMINDDSLTELLNHLSGTTRSGGAARPPQPTSANLRPFTNPPEANSDLPQTKEEQSNISTRFLLDTLSDEEDSSPDEYLQEKCDFFQDLLLSTLTDRRLTINISVPDQESESDISESEDPVGFSGFKKYSKKGSSEKGEKRSKSGSEGSAQPLLENNNNRSQPVISSDSEPADEV